MADFDKLKNLFLTLPDLGPVIKGWNRLEGRPRQLDLERSLRAEIRDPLWMLTRQWQFGELQGEDAGSPIEVKLATQQDFISQYTHLNETFKPLNQDIPTAATIEAESWPRDLSLAIRIGRYFSVLLQRHAVDQSKTFYIIQYPIEASYLQGNATTQDINTFDAIEGKMIDGIKLLDAIHSGAHRLWIDQHAAINNSAKTKLKTLESLLLQWYTKHFVQSAGSRDASWSKERLEYQFSIASMTGSQNILLSDQYEGQSLDWYAYDHASTSNASMTFHQKMESLSFIPAPISFTGMPLPRYWEIENTRLEWSNLELHKRNLIQMVLIEFMLTYANDWCVIPYERKVGSLCDIEYMLVTDTFGNKVMIPPFASIGDTDRDIWSFMKISDRKGNVVDYSYLPHAPGKQQESAPIEKIIFIRDEMANTVWAIENTIPNMLGEGMNGYESSLAQSNELTPDTNTPQEALKYVLGQLPPSHWIPFIPVHIPGSSSEIRLQRGKLPGFDNAYRGRVLDQKSPYFIFEEEIPRSGKQVQRRYVRTRNHKGETFLWIGRKVNTGKGEGSSGIRWDLIE